MKSRRCMVCRGKRQLLEDERICPDCQWLRKWDEGLKKRRPKGSFWTVPEENRRKACDRPGT
jgi:hypothetical protein